MNGLVMLDGFLSELDHIKSNGDTILLLLARQLTTRQETLAYTSVHGQYESFMQLMSGVAFCFLSSLSNPETYLDQSYHSQLHELATKFGHYPQWRQHAIITKMTNWLSDYSVSWYDQSAPTDPPEISDPTPVNTLDNVTPMVENNTPRDTQGFNSPIDSSIVIQVETNNSDTETVDQDMDITDQPLDTLDNAPTPPIDTSRHPMVYPDFELDFELDPELDVDTDFEPDDELDFNMPQDIVPTETPSDPSETNDNRPPLVDNNNPSNNQNLNGPPDIDVESNIVTDSDFDTDSDSDLDSDIEDIEGTFLTICEEIKKNIPPRRPIPLFSFG